jgi:hypothetical protein
MERRNHATISGQDQMAQHLTLTVNGNAQTIAVDDSRPHG